MANLPVRQQWVPERRAFVQSLFNEFPLYSTREELPSGFYVGQPIPMEDGRLFRISHAEEDLVLGRATYHGGGEFSHANIGVKASGDKQITLTGIDSPYNAQAFMSGTLRITGGPSDETGYTWVIGGNSATTQNADTSTLYDITLFMTMPIPIDLDETVDVIVQANQYTCQRYTQATGEDLDFPKFYTGYPMLPVPAGHYYHNLVGGPATGIAQAAMSDVDDEDQVLVVSRASADDIGKLARSGSDATSQEFARLVTRSNNNFAADAFIPVWVLPK